MPITGTPSPKSASGTRGLPASVTLAGPPDRITACGANSARKSGVTFWNGWISQKIRASRSRRAMSCVTWLPKSTMRRR